MNNANDSLKSEVNYSQRQTENSKENILEKALFFLIFYTLIVILWGAWVRFSHSGDGCGESWPLCQGELIPQTTQNKTWIEYAHRATSGLFGIYVFILFYLIKKIKNKSSELQFWSRGLLLFTITEALLGAKLVLLGLVGANFSGLRTIAMSLHQINSLVLMATVFMTWWCLRGQTQKDIINNQIKFRTKIPLILFILLATTGTWASLASTLFPSTSLLEGFLKDIAQESHHTLRLRIFHPIFGLLFGGGLIYWISTHATENLKIQKRVLMIFGAAVFFGVLTLLSLSPNWMKVSHLAIAHLCWLSLLRWSLLEKI